MNIHCEVNRKTQNWTHGVRGAYSNVSILFVTQRPIFLWKLYRYKSPDRECDRQPDGDCMESLTKYRVEVYEYCPSVRVFVEIRADVNVDVKSEGYVVEHDEEVCDGEAGEDRVRGGDHLLAAEDRDVDGVGGGAQEADEQGDVPVYLDVHALEVAPSRVAVRHRICHLLRHLASPLLPRSYFLASVLLSHD